MSTETNKEISTKATEEFNWENYEKDLDILVTGADQSEELEAILSEEDKESLESLKNKQVVTGFISQKTDRYVVVDINGKSEGIISLNEFRYNPDIKVGDEIDVFISKLENQSGAISLSHKQAKVIKSWESINKAYENGEVIKGLVKCRTKGGMIVDAMGIETFLPGSQIDVRPITDYDLYVGKTMEFKVIKINYEFKNIVLSHKALIEADIQKQKKEIIKNLEKGQILEGTVKNLTSYGAFIDLGGVDGLVHITDVSWNRISHPSEILEIDQKIQVVILEFDDEGSRIQLGIKQLNKHPWDNLSPDLKVGDKVKGTVTVLADYGAFVEIVDSVEGLIHVSEMSWSTHLRSAHDFVKVGDVLEVVILTLNREERRISLGLKQLKPDPWENAISKYKLGTIHTATVKNFSNFGIFAEIEEGIDGLIHISDLSWSKKVKHPSEFLKIGDRLEVVVLSLDVAERKLSLGHKQALPNPWEKFENKYPEGTTVQGEILEFISKGASIKLEDNDEVYAFSPNRHLEKEDGSRLEVGEKSNFKVIEFNKDLKRIVVSHTATFKDDMVDKRPRSKTNTSKGDRGTLGDLEALADIKEKLSKNE